MYTLFDGELKLENLDTHRPAVMNGIECIVINLELSAVNVKIATSCHFALPDNQ